MTLLSKISNEEVNDNLRKRFECVLERGCGFGMHRGRPRLRRARSIAALRSRLAPGMRRSTCALAADWANAHVGSDLHRLSADQRARLIVALPPDWSQVNPFRMLPIYDDATLRSYRGKNRRACSLSSRLARPTEIEQWKCRPTSTRSPSRCALMARVRVCAEARSGITTSSLTPRVRETGRRGDAEAQQINAASSAESREQARLRCVGRGWRTVLNRRRRRRRCAKAHGSEACLRAPRGREHASSICPGCDADPNHSLRSWSAFIPRAIGD